MYVYIVIFVCVCAYVCMYVYVYMYVYNNNKSFQLINTHHVSYIKIGKSNLKYSILFILFLSDGKGSHTYIPVTGPLPPL